MKKTFLITRPQNDSAKIVQFLESQGFSTVIEETFSVENLPFTAQNSIDKNTQALIITSSNACHTVINSGISLDIKIFAVGKQSAYILNEAGYKNIFYPQISSAQNLQKLIAENAQPQNGKLLYFCGNYITLDFKQSLEHLGFSVDKIPAYKIHWHENFSTEFLQKISETSIDFILFYSQNSIKNFHRMAKHNNLLEYFSHSKLFCFSEKIALVAKNLGFKNCAQFNEFPLLKNFYK